MMHLINLVNLLDYKERRKLIDHKLIKEMKILKKCLLVFMFLCVSITLFSFTNGKINNAYANENELVIDDAFYDPDEVIQTTMLDAK